MGNTKKNKISVVTPSYNQASFIEETICSVLDQKYPNLEYIVIDGGSSDDSVAIIKKYSKYLHYWVSEKDGGHANALNKGFKMSSGEIMSWLNSDDKYLPWTFNTINSVFNELSNVRWVQGNPSTWDKNGTLVTSNENQKNRLDYVIGNYGWIQQESTFWRRSLWLESGGYIDESYLFMIDGELWSRFFLYDNLYRLNRVVGGFRIHDSNRSGAFFSSCISEMNSIINKTRPELIKLYIPQKDYLFFSKLFAIFSKTKLPKNTLKLIDFIFPRLFDRYKYFYIDQIGDNWEIRTSKYRMK